MNDIALSGSTVITQRRRTAARVLDEQAVVVVIDEQSLHTLCPVGTRVWELAQDAPLDRIVRTIVTEYEVTERTARVDVEAFVRDMIARGMLEIVVPT